MAGSGRRVFAPGEVLTASNVMNYLQDQAVMNFAGTAARGSAIGTAASEGMVSYLNDTDSLEVYRAVGTASPTWQPVAFESYTGNSGLIPVSNGTATVAGAGSSVSENALGTITFGTATSLTFDNVFTSTYTDYKVLLVFSGSATTFNVTSQFRAAGSTLSAASYNWAHTYTNLGAAFVFETAGNSTSMTAFQNALGAGVNILEYTIAQPTNAATRTQIAGVAMRSRNSGIVSADYAVTTAVDGFTLVPSTGNFSGTLTVYGFNR